VLTNWETSSLASQAVGPTGSDVEMACAGRAMNGANSLGAKLLVRAALQFQTVNPTDSVLGSLANTAGNGLKCGAGACTYQQLVDAAFGTSLGAQAQAQFSRFWGQAVAAYEATLIPDQTPYDKFLAGNSSALTSSQKDGLDRFQGKGGCTKCHAGTELSDATVSFAASKGLINEDGGDQGFHNIGVRPTAEDLGRAGTGPKGASWSVSKAAADRGAFKTPGLRNVKLTAPYFHNGGKATLADVVDFYSRGGDFKNAEKSKRIQTISFDAKDKAALVDFLTNALTDCRVEKERAPFDHPSLVIPNGESLTATGASGTGSCP
jgi:cytochrome c peroxidase